MPKNYDELRDADDASFIVRGETFTYRRVPYTVLDKMDVLQRDFVKSLEVDDATWEAGVQFALDRLTLLLEPEAATRFRALCVREEDPVTYREIMDISREAYEWVTGIPTQPPTPSESGRGKTAGPLKAA